MTTLAVGPKHSTLDGQPAQDAAPSNVTVPEPVQPTVQHIVAALTEKLGMAIPQDTAANDEQARLAYLKASRAWRANLARCDTFAEFAATMTQVPEEPARADWLINSWRVDSSMTEPSDTQKLFAAAVGRNRVLPMRARWPQEARALCETAYGQRYLSCDPAQVMKRDKLDQATSVILAGNVGTGKTTSLVYHIQRLAERMAMDPKHQYDQPLFACYRSSALFDILFDGDNAVPWDARGALYLALDDVGREYSSPFPLHRFEELVEERYAAGKGFIITTNMDKLSFMAREGWDRIADRLLEVCSWIDMTRPTSMRQR